jgi:hypothetical protein
MNKQRQQGKASKAKASQGKQRQEKALAGFTYSR